MVGINFGDWSAEQNLAVQSALSSLFNISPFSVRIDGESQNDILGGLDLNVKFFTPTTADQLNLYNALLGTFPANSSSYAVSVFEDNGIFGITQLVDPPVLGKPVTISSSAAKKSVVVSLSGRNADAMTDQRADTLRIIAGNYLAEKDNFYGHDGNITTTIAKPGSNNVQFTFHAPTQAQANNNADIFADVIANEHDDLVTYTNQHGFAGLDEFVPVAKSRKMFFF